jgi:amino acid transporter
MASTENTDTEPQKFGTFAGVFVPNVLTILGVIMFLRTGWVVGQAGLTGALIILGIANLITFLTSLSLSAIATNSKVGGGGAYYLISRSLGLEIGGSIGVPLFIAQAISAAFYVIGFTESILAFFPEADPRLIAAGVLTVLFSITWIGSDIAIKTQNLILILLGLALLSFFAGWEPVNHLTDNLSPADQPDIGFWIIFAIFFPAVTGIMSGASMSGDLKDPSRSIPRGTLAAVVITTIIYGAQMFWLAKHADRETLLTNNLVMNELSVFSPLIYIGLWAATLSSALASFLGAPRTLQALSRDGVLPRFLGRTHGKKSEPRIALIFSFLIAQVCIFLGDLNLIAPIISMFFLVTYGMVNLVSGLERWVFNPSYRPTFRVPWILSLLGALGCVFVMFVINALATIVAITLVAGLYAFLTTRRYQTAWGDTRSGFWFSLTRFALLKFTTSHQHLRNWRPIILVLSGNPKVRTRLVQFAHWMESKRGFLFLAQILTGNWESNLQRKPAALDSMKEFIDENDIAAEAQVVLSQTFDEGVSTLLQASGVGPLKPNTVLVGWSEDAIKQGLFLRTIHRILELKRNLILFIEAEKEPSELNQTIDVWWRAKLNGTLMLTLAHLIHSNPHWKNHTVRLLLIIKNKSGIEEATANITQQLKDARISGSVKVIVSEEPPLEVIQKESSHSEVTFIGINLQTLTNDENPLKQYEDFAHSFKGNVFLTKSWQDLELN